MVRLVLLRFGAVAALAFPVSALAQGDAAIAAPGKLTASYSLAAPSLARAAPVARGPYPQPAVALPRDIPEVIADDARQVPGIDWTSAQGAKIKLRPHRLRLTFDF